jgi:hypothetical protein
VVGARDHVVVVGRDDGARVVDARDVDGAWVFDVDVEVRVRRSRATRDVDVDARATRRISLGNARRGRRRRGERRTRASDRRGLARVRVWIR